MGIQGHASLIAMRMTREDPNYQHLKGIEEMVQRGSELTRQLLGFARAGRYDVRPSDLNEIMSKSARMFGRTKKEIVIRERYEKNLWPV
ncbi:MAG: hybrid sensor histidine kinase/response regulator, partial [Deltaproteobacteria bacterium]